MGRKEGQRKEGEKADKSTKLGFWGLKGKRRRRKGSFKFYGAQSLRVSSSSPPPPPLPPSLNSGQATTHAKEERRGEEYPPTPIVSPLRNGKYTFGSVNSPAIKGKTGFSSFPEKTAGGRERRKGQTLDYLMGVFKDGIYIGATINASRDQRHVNKESRDQV